MTEKEKLIRQLVNEGKQGLEKTMKDQEEMIKDYQENGINPEMHQDNVESYKTGLSYTQGYCIGHLELLKNINQLLSMSVSEINQLIEENKKIEEQNKKHLDDVFKKIGRSN